MFPYDFVQLVNVYLSVCPKNPPANAKKCPKKKLRPCPKGKMCCPYGCKSLCVDGVGK